MIPHLEDMMIAIIKTSRAMQIPNIPRSGRLRCREYLAQSCQGLKWHATSIRTDQSR